MSADDVTPLPLPDPLHVCPHPHCRKRVPALIWACAEHWQALPPPVRQAIWWANLEQSDSALESARKSALVSWRAQERFAA
jgi:hypothetical protein